MAQSDQSSHAHSHSRTSLGRHIFYAQLTTLGIVLPMVLLIVAVGLGSAFGWEWMSFHWAGFMLGGLGVLGTGFSVSMVISKYFLKRISRPFKHLIAVTRKMNESEVFTVDNFKNQMDEPGSIEVQLLTQEITKMLAQIHVRDCEIRNAYANMENQVRETTKELYVAQTNLVHVGRMSAVGEMAAGIAHEINNPLAVIMSRCSQMIRKVSGGQPGKEEILDGLEKTLKMTRRIAKIVQGLRTLSRDASKDDFEIVSFKSIVEEILDLCGERFKAHGIDLRIGQIVDADIECRPTQIGEIILNLMNNAFDAIEDLPEKWVELRTRADQGRIEIFVTDSGAGIPPEVQEKMMNPFFTTKPVGKGTGLGLSIARGILESHNGEMRVDNECPNTRFVIHLPITEKKQKRAVA